MPRTSYAELHEPTACAVQFAREHLGPRLAQSVGKHLGCTVTFSHWQAPSFTGGPETPVFVVPDGYAERAKRMGLTIR